MSRLDCMLAAFLVLQTAVRAEEAGVSFSGMEFTMTCPGPEDVKWYKVKNTNAVLSTTDRYTQQYNKDSEGAYYCTVSDTEIYQFFVRGKVCENCYELDGMTVLFIIVGDIVLTSVVILLAYLLAKKKNPTESTSTKAGSSQAAGRSGPPVPSPDYEPLRSQTRNQDTYSTVHRTG